jgi:hypothetical protein
MPILRNFLSLTIASLLLGAPAFAAETGFKVPVVSRDVNASFWVAAPQYTCPMDPDVHAEAPGSCPKCHMDLERTATLVRLEAKTASGKSLAGRTALIRVIGKSSSAKGAKFNKDGVAEASFVMPAGKYTLTAELVTPGSRHNVKLSAPYQVR